MSKHYLYVFLIICPQSNTIINTAILTNQPVSLPVIVLAISKDGKVSDVTSAVTCYSTNENTVKVQPNPTYTKGIVRNFQAAVRISCLYVHDNRFQFPTVPKKVLRKVEQHIVHRPRVVQTLSTQIKSVSI